MTPASDWPLFRISRAFNTGNSQLRRMRTVLHEAYAPGSVSTSRGQVLFPSVSVLLHYINFPVPDHLSPYPIRLHIMSRLAVSLHWPYPRHRCMRSTRPVRSLGDPPFTVVGSKSTIVVPYRCVARYRISSKSY